MGDAPTSGAWRRRLVFGALYFSEGAPIGYVWWALPTRLRAAGMPVDEVAALTALLTLPWALKFLWAPAVDALRGRRWGLRCWIVVAQAAMALTLLPLAVLPLDQLIDAAVWILVLHAVAAATQDVSIDALAMNTLAPEERGRVTGWMQAGYLLARALFGGLALTAERWISGQAVVGVMIGCVLALMVVVAFAPAAPEAGEARIGERMSRFARAIGRILLRRATYIGLGIALTAGAGFEAVGGLMGSFLTDAGVEKESVGAFLALPVVGCMIAGALAGGWLADRFGHRWLVISAVAAIALWVGVLAGTYSAAPRSIMLLMSVAAPIYLLLGTLTASSYALFMDLTDPDAGGTQFSAFMSATNLCEVWAVAMAGTLAARSGYGAAFLAAAGVSLLAIPLALSLGKGNSTNAIAAGGAGG